MVSSSGSLLQQAVVTFQPLVPSRQTYVVVPAHDEARATAQIASWSGAQVLGVREGLGSASSVMQILAEVLSTCPEADVIVASADGYVAHPESFLRAFVSARGRLGMVPAVVLGAAVARPMSSGQWLLPGKRIGESLYSFREAHEPSTEEDSRRLMAQGAMWNTSTFVARARFLWQVLARVLPKQAESIIQLWRMGWPASETLAHAVAAAAPGEPVLEHCEVLLREGDSIAVTKVEGSGFSDWSSPEEVLHSLPNPLERGWLLSRLASEAASASPLSTAPSSHPREGSTDGEARE
jgi:hypothetical protein